MGNKSETEIFYHLLTLLSGDRDLTQRDIAKALGISLGKANYCLSALIQKNLIRANRLRIPRDRYSFRDLATKGFINIDRGTESQNKTKYIYVLTPEGVAEKNRMAVQLLNQKLADLETIQRQIDELKKQITSESSAAARTD